MSRFTITMLRAQIEETNAELETIGSKTRLEFSPRNGYQGVDSRHPEKPGAATVGVGTSRECSDAIDSWLLERMAQADGVQYTDKLNNVYKVVNDQPMVWGHPLDWQPSAKYLSLGELLKDGQVKPLTDKLRKR